MTDDNPSPLQWPGPTEPFTREHAKAFVDESIRVGELAQDCRNFGVPYRGRRRTDVVAELIEKVYLSQHPEEQEEWPPDIIDLASDGL